MPMFRKINSSVEVFQIHVDPYPDWFKDAVGRGDVECFWKNRDICDPLGNFDCVIIKTHNGVHRADAGDYIIKDGNFRIYPCKPDIFEMTYEPVETQP